MGQGIEVLNPPEDINSYVFKEREVKMARPCCDPMTGELLGLYDTIGFLVVRGDDEEHILNYGYDETKSKLPCSFYKRRIPNAFGRKMFSRHRVMYESGEMKTDFSKVFFFLPSITYQSEEINHT